MSQSAASGALGDLETLFDCRLFDRVGKRLQLNELGRSVRARAEAVMDRARDLEQAFEQESTPGGLRVGATLTIGNYLGVHLAARFMRDHPGARVVLDVANTAEIARRVANFEIDVGLVEGELHHPDLTVTRWRRDELVVFCAASHPLARKRSLSDDDLRAAKWIVREKGSGTRQAFERAMHGLMPELEVALELQHTEAIKNAVHAGLGIACLSRLTLEQEFRDGTLRPRPVVGHDFGRWFYFLLHRRKFKSAAIERWLTLCRAV
jgi:DNA-binding transcriptional LysR family regulator